eukprot:c15069_g1_i3 orf=1401-1895(+)
MLWENSEHVGHLRLHPEEYKDAVKKMLVAAASVYSERIQSYDSEAAINKYSVLGSETARDLPIVSQRQASSWVVLPERTAEKIQFLSKLPHFGRVVQKEWLYPWQFNNLSNNYQGIELEDTDLEAPNGDQFEDKCESNQSYLAVRELSLPSHLSMKKNVLRSRL